MLFVAGQFAALLSGACALPVLHESTESVDLVIAATTDVHAYLRGWDYYGNRPDTLRGLTRAATIIDSLRRVSAVSPVLVDAGDMLQGTPIAYVAARIDTTMPHPVMLAMNAMGYTAAVVGNHEFNYGLPALERAMHQAAFPLLAANVFTPDGKPRFQAWAVAMRNGIKIGIVGATTPGSMVWDRDNLAGRLVIRDIVPSVRSAVREARDAGAAVVIAVVHSGLDEPSSYDTVSTGVPSENVAARLAHEVPDIDVLVYGHSHKEMADTIIGKTLLMACVWRNNLPVAFLVPCGCNEIPSSMSAIALLTISSRKRLVCRALRATSDIPFLLWSSSSSVTIGI